LSLSSSAPPGWPGQQSFAIDLIYIETIVCFLTGVKRFVVLWEQSSQSLLREPRTADCMTDLFGLTESCASDKDKTNGCSKVWMRLDFSAISVE